MTIVTSNGTLTFTNQTFDYVWNSINGYDYPTITTEFGQSPATAILNGSVTGIDQGITVDVVDDGNSIAQYYYVGYVVVDGVICYGFENEGNHSLIDIISTQPGVLTANTNYTFTEGIPNVCFAAGTRIATPAGEVPVEHLSAGDTVTTLEGPRQVVWLGHNDLDVRKLANPEAAYLVRIRKHAFAENVPHRDLLVTQDHCVFVNGKFIPARLLVNERSIMIDRGITAYRYYHVELERHGVLLAEGLETESYLDTGNRVTFGDDKLPAPRADLPAPASWDDAYAPLAVDPESVEPVWQRLAKRAGVSQDMIGGSFTQEPALHLLVDGLELWPVSEIGGRRYLFTLPAGCRKVVIASRAASPSAQRPWLDDRRMLGVAISSATLMDGDCLQPLDLAGEAAVSGWHGMEKDAATGKTWCWTDGEAILGLPEGEGAARLLVLKVHGTVDYPLTAPLPQRLALAG
jgi:hypothetical protein